MSDVSDRACPAADQAEKLGWGLQERGQFASATALLQMPSFAIVPSLMRRLGLLRSLRLSLLSATAGLFINSRATLTWHFYAGVLAGCLHIQGGMGGSPAVSALITHEAQRVGFGQGELQGMISNLGSVAGTVGPLVCKLPRYRCHLGCIPLKTPAISLPSGLHSSQDSSDIVAGRGQRILVWEQQRQRGLLLRRGHGGDPLPMRAGVPDPAGWRSAARGRPAAGADDESAAVAAGRCRAPGQRAGGGCAVRPLCVNVVHDSQTAAAFFPG
eukprot:COSAG04_NODE_523_length_13126_cov_19.987570_9_plen_271_part_00